MEIRQLKSTDLFPVCKIIKKIGIDEFRACFSRPEVIKLMTEDAGSGSKENQIAYTILFDMAVLIIGNLPNAKDEIYDFLSDVTGAKTEEIEDLSPAEFAALVIEVLKRKEFADFIAVVSGSFK